MATMNDVRAALWAAYKKLEAKDGVIEDKSSEGLCELQYPKFWNCQDAATFAEPCGLIIYSYAFGPSRRNCFNRGEADRQVNYCTWEAPDFYAKAVEIVNSWAAAVDSWAGSTPC
jgi:hypothetical protein